MQGSPLFCNAEQWWPELSVCMCVFTLLQLVGSVCARPSLWPPISFNLSMKIQITIMYTDDSFVHSHTLTHTTSVAPHTKLAPALPLRLLPAGPPTESLVPSSAPTSGH